MITNQAALGVDELIRDSLVPGADPQPLHPGIVGHQTGKLLRETKLPADAFANPITYLGRDGKQYVLIAAQEAMIAFRLALPPRVRSRFAARAAPTPSAPLSSYRKKYLGPSSCE